jgi:hypothetical protein
MIAQSLGHIIIQVNFRSKHLSIILFNTVFVTSGVILRPSSQYFSKY